MKSIVPAPNLSTPDLQALPRYKYRSPLKPTTGNRVEAERAFAQALKAQESHRSPDAVLAYQQATQADPAYYEAWYNLALANSAAGTSQAALVAYEHALAIRPDSQDARYNFALALKQTNYPVDAARELEAVIAASPNEVRAHLGLANLYAQQLHQPVAARQHYLRVLELDPKHPQASAIRFWLAANP